MIKNENNRKTNNQLSIKVVKKQLDPTSNVLAMAQCKGLKKQDYFFYIITEIKFKNMDN